MSPLLISTFVLSLYIQVFAEDSRNLSESFPSANKVEIEEDKNARKKLLDTARQGVVIIKTKAFASADPSSAYAYGEKTWSGTGFIVDKEKGLIATNKHITGLMTVCTYEVKFADGTKAKAKCFYVDPYYDFAFLKIDPVNFPKECRALEFDSEPVKVNDTIYAMGNSAGDEFSTHKGTIFSIYENIGPFSDQSFKFSGLTVGGASGSPVFRENGKVIGIIYGSKFVSGVGLPISYIKRTLANFLQNKVPDRNSIGLLPNYMDIKDLSETGMLPKINMENYLKEFPDCHNKILVVTDRLVNSPANSIFLPGDILWKINGELIGPRLEKIDQIIDSFKDGTIMFQVFREGKIVTLEVKSYSLKNTTTNKLVNFAGASWHEGTEYTRLMYGNETPGIYISYADKVSPFRNMTENSKAFFSLTKPLKITCIDNKPIHTLENLMAIIPTLQKKEVFTIRYIDLLGERSIDSLKYADRQERFAVIRYESKFDEPKFFNFNFDKLEWDAKDLKEKEIINKADSIKESKESIEKTN